MSKNMQPLSMLPVQPGEDLFGTDSGYEDPRSAELRIAQTVAHIAARARPVAYEMRVSEATADQGHAHMTILLLPHCRFPSETLKRILSQIIKSKIYFLKCPAKMARRTAGTNVSRLKK
jgi:hypothetical protein